MNDNLVKRNKAISSVQFIASAGTGKTHQVTSLYTSLILGKPYPLNSLGSVPAGGIFSGITRIPCEEIIMLTFARNAASEMRNRITHAIERELERDEENADFYWNLLRRLSGAVISTIHSFSQRLLAQNALYLGITPSFRVLEEDEAENLLRESLFHELRNSLNSSEDEENKAMKTICLGRKKTKTVIDAAASFIRQCDSLGIDVAMLAPDELLPVPPRPKLSDLVDLARYYEKSTAGETPYKPAQSFIRRLGEDIDRLGRNPTSATVSESALDLLEVTKMSWGKDGMKQVREDIKSRLVDLGNYSEQLRTRELLAYFLEYIGRSRRSYEMAKRELGVLDFSDLLIKARDLVLSKPEILPEVSVIIVDEAQDNSRAQNELIEKIREATGAALILCGDIKQTIHTWRGADPEGMKKLARRFKLIPVPLRTSYRSRKSILDWVNAIFREVVFDEIKYDENAHLLPCEHAPTGAGPSVELLLPEWEASCSKVTIPKTKPVEKEGLELTDQDLKILGEKGENTEGISAARWLEWSGLSDKRYSLEARAVAERISILCREDGDPSFRPDKIYHPDSWWDNNLKSYRYRDIMILLRATGRQELYEAALRERGIPFTSDGKGRGLYFRQEVRDISNLLKMLAFPRDDLALLAVLRSPFFSLSDEAIGVLLSREGKIPKRFMLRRALFGRTEHLREYEEMICRAGLDEDVESYRRATSIIRQLRRLSGKMNGIDLIRRVIDLTGYDAILVGAFNGLQRLANLRAILAELQEKERRKHYDLSGMALYLHGKIKDKSQSPDAAVLDPSNDAVVISTAHASKGLSRPVIFIPDLRRPLKSSRSWIRIGRGKEVEHWVAGCLRVLEPAGEEMDLISFGRVAVEQAARLEEEEEARRLFYVAATRARDLLVLSGENSGRKGSWRNWINDYILAGYETFAPIRIIPYPLLRKEAGPPAREGKKSEISSVDLSAVDEHREESVVLPEFYRFTATVLSGVPERQLYKTEEKFQKARREYVRAGLVNLPPSYFMSKGGMGEKEGEISVNSGDWEEEDPSGSGVEAGILGHAILERIDFNRPVEGQVREMIGGDGRGNKSNGFLEARILAAAADIAEIVKDAEPDKVIRELPFTARFFHKGATVLVDGAIDLIYFKEAAWHIVDYKFSNRSASDLKKKYGLQLAIYRDAVSNPVPGREKRSPLFMEGDKPAHFTMTILGINSEGKVNRVPIPEGEVGDVHARVVAAARLIQEETFPS